MNKKYSLLICLGFIAHFFLGAQLTITVTNLPPNTPMADDIYIAGNFNNWEAGDDNFKLARNEDDQFFITFEPPVNDLEFKFTRGSWETVEGNDNGGFLSNRTLSYDGSATNVSLTIASWENTEDTGNSTAADNVYYLDEDFYLPQLMRNRRIWLYLPPDYHTSNKSYPVLYLHDGQNLFDRSTSFSGEWEIDETLNELFSQGDDGIIVIGIDNGGGSRIDEYVPWETTYSNQTIGGEGDEYAEFLVETLKPYVDDNFRTLTDQSSTGIMGSSLGGTISMYAAIRYQEVFGKAGIFSPAFWLTPESYEQVTTTGKRESIKFYLMAGEQEDDTMVSNLYRMDNTLDGAGFEDDNRLVVTRADGTHSEWFWAREFRAAYEWLFGDVVANSEETFNDLQIQLSPNPVSNILRVESLKPIDQPKVAFFSMDGRLIKSITSLNDNAVDISFLRNGMYMVLVSSDCKAIFNQKIVVQRGE